MFNPFKVFSSIWFILFVSFDLHMFLAALAGGNYVFDECYYVPASRATVDFVAANIEHPPLVKFIVGLSMKVFGDNWFAWRFPIILFALLATWLTYKIARRFLSERASVFSAGLLSLSIIFLLTGSVVMLDIPCLVFGLAGLLLVLKGRFVWGGVLFGLSFLCKELAVLMFVATWVYMVFKRVGWMRQLFFGVVVFAVAFGGVWMYDSVFAPVAGDVVIRDPVTHFGLMVVWQLNLHGVRAPVAASWFPPICWVSPFGNGAWEPLGWLWCFSGGRVVFAFLAQPNAAVEYLMFPLLFVLPVLFWLRRNCLAVLAWLWVAFAYLPWFIGGFFDRTEANFYIVYSVPFLAIGSAYLYTFVKDRRLRYGLALVHLGVGVIWFLYYFPVPLFR